MKRFAVVFVFLLLMTCVAAHAATYCDTSGRINYYYQLDGGKTDQIGTYDKLLVPVIREITGGKHDYIVPWDNLYLTGRGCDLFAYGHAYQYLLGYAGSTQAKADVLAVYLRGISGQSRTWSTNAPTSTLNPPKACSLYSQTLDSKSGVTKYSKSLSTFGELYNFFNGCRGVCIVNVGGHYVCAVGCTEHNKEKYVLIVDSIMSATLRSDRRGYGYSFDFSIRYDETNARQNEAAVHQYWLPYSAFTKCTIAYSFYVGQAPKDYRLRSPYVDGAVVTLNETLDLMVYDQNGAASGFVFESTDPSVVTVDEYGVLAAVGTGAATVSCYAVDNPYQLLEIPVYVFEWVHPGDAYVVEDSRYPVVISGCELPSSFDIGWTESGLAVITDLYGNTVYEMQYTLLDGNTDLFRLPASVKIVEESAFADLSSSAILIDNPDILLSPGAFESGIELYFLEEDNWYTKK